MLTGFPVFLIEAASIISASIAVVLFAVKIILLLSASYNTFRWYPIFNEFCQYIMMIVNSLRVSFMVICFSLLTIFVIYFVSWTIVFVYLGSSVDVVPLGDGVGFNHLQATLYGVIHFLSLFFVSSCLLNIERLIITDLVLNWYYVIDTKDWRRNVDACAKKIFTHHIGSAVAATIHFNLRPLYSGLSYFIRRISFNTIKPFSFLRQMKNLKQDVFFYIVSQNIGFYDALLKSNSLSASSNIYSRTVDATLNNFFYLIKTLPTIIMLLISTPFFKYYYFNSRYIYTPVFLIVTFCHFMFLSFVSAVEIVGKVILAALIVDKHFSHQSLHNRHIKLEFIECVSKLNVAIKHRKSGKKSAQQLLKASIN